MPQEYSPGFDKWMKHNNGNDNYFLKKNYNNRNIDDLLLIILSFSIARAPGFDEDCCETLGIGSFKPNNNYEYVQ